MAEQILFDVADELAQRSLEIFEKTGDEDIFDQVTKIIGTSSQTLEEARARAGESGEILSSNLLNYAMPFIRYAPGDAGRLVPEACPCGRGLERIGAIEGRVRDVIVTADGRRVHGALARRHREVQKEVIVPVDELQDPGDLFRVVSQSDECRCDLAHERCPGQSCAGRGEPRR